MNSKAKQIPDVGRWSTIVVAVAFAVATSVLGVVDVWDDRHFGFEFRELVRDLIWMLSWAWFLSNALRVLDTMERLALRVMALAAFGAVLIWFSSTLLASTLDYGIRSVSDADDLALSLYCLTLGVIALLSIFRHALLKNPGGVFGGVTSQLSISFDDGSVFRWLIRILVHPFKSIRRDPIRWSAIAGALIWPTISIWAFPALLVQGIAITCAIRYADTYGERRIIRIAALVLATVFVWVSFFVTVPFGPLQIAWLGPSLVLWTGSAVSAMFRPSMETNETEDANNALLFHTD